MKLPRLSELFDKVNELKELKQELDQMYSAWNSDDNFAQASNDPSRQYEKENEIESKLKEIGSLF